MGDLGLPFGKNSLHPVLMSTIERCSEIVAQCGEMILDNPEARSDHGMAMACIRFRRRVQAAGMAPAAEFEAAAGGDVRCAEDASRKSEVVRLLQQLEDEACRRAVMVAALEELHRVAEGAIAAGGWAVEPGTAPAEIMRRAAAILEEEAR